MVEEIYNSLGYELATAPGSRPSMISAGALPIAGASAARSPSPGMRRARLNQTPPMGMDTIVGRQPMHGKPSATMMRGGAIVGGGGCVGGGFGNSGVGIGGGIAGHGAVGTSGVGSGAFGGGVAGSGSSGDADTAAWGGELRAILKRAACEHHLDKFRQQQLDAEALSLMRDTDFYKMGVTEVRFSGRWLAVSSVDWFRLLVLPTCLHSSFAWKMSWRGHLGEVILGAKTGRFTAPGKGLSFTCFAVHGARIYCF